MRPGASLDRKLSTSEYAITMMQHHHIMQAVIGEEEDIKGLSTTQY